MKKEYEKPIAELVVFEVTDAIATCETKVQATVECYKVLDPNIFNTDEGCTRPEPEKYCYNNTLIEGAFTS